MKTVTVLFACSVVFLVVSVSILCMKVVSERTAKQEAAEAAEREKAKHRYDMTAQQEAEYRAELAETRIGV